MIRKLIAGAAAFAAATTAVLVGVQGGAGAATVPSLQAFGISPDGTLMATWQTNQPQVLNWVRDVVFPKGVADTALVGIDHRVQDGLMYGVGNYGGIYIIRTPSDPAPPTPPSDVVLEMNSQLTVPLYGTTFGVDFNPAADRLRIISDNGQNLSHDLNTDTTTEQAVLTTPPATGPTKAVTAAAYTNNDLVNTTNTTLFDINTGTDQVVIQSPPGNGFLVATGSLGVDAALNAGADIYSDLSGGKTVSNMMFATLLSSSGTATFYTVEPLTGVATSVGNFPTRIPIADVTVRLDKG